MALKIRLRQQGRRNRPFYRLVLADSRSPRNGKYQETLGWYNPQETKAELFLKVEGERVQHWIDQGVEVSDKAQSLIKQAVPGLIQKWHEKQNQKKVRASKRRRDNRAKRKAATA
jgi:small subunit ribosomal protein S16